MTLFCHVIPSSSERESQVDHLNGDDPPVHPNGEPDQQAGDGDPQVPTRDLLTSRLPELLVLNIPLFDIGHSHSLRIRRSRRPLTRDAYAVYFC